MSTTRTSSSKDRAPSSAELSESASARLAAIVESSDDAIISKDLDGIITSWNAGAELLFGYTAAEAIGRPVTILIPEDRIDEEPDILNRIRHGEKIDHYETVRRRKDARLVDISLTISPIVGADGSIIGASKIARNITQRKEDETRLSMLASIVEFSDDAIISKDLNGTITSWNHGAERIFGYTAEDAIGQPVTILIPEERIDEEPGILNRIRRGEKIDHYETIRRRKDGTLLNISLSVSPIVDIHNRIIGAAKIARDITAHKQAEYAAKEREIMLRLIELQETERRRIARDLHDHVGQEMTALRLKIEPLLEGCSRDPTLHNGIHEVRGIAEKIDHDLGFLSWEMRPTELDALGLEGSLSSFVREWSHQYEIKAEFQPYCGRTKKKPARLSRTIETNFYRIVQEALNNILKHAEANSVSIVFSQTDNEAVLVIEDDGRGFDPKRRSPNEDIFDGQGLTGMKERAGLLNGSFEIESKPGQGTTIIIRAPVA